MKMTLVACLGSVVLLGVSCCMTRDAECCKTEVSPVGEEKSVSAASENEVPAESISNALVQAEGQPVSLELKSVDFANGSAVLSQEAQAALDQNADILKANREVAVEVQGLASATGPKALNEKLAAKRSQAAKDYLVKKGIEANRINIGDAKVGATRAAVFQVRKL